MSASLSCTISHYTPKVVVPNEMHMPHIGPRTLALLPGCVSEQAAARALGFTQASWDNGEEPLGDTNWCGLTHEQRMAGRKLGYTEASWDNLSGKEPQPASDDKFFAELKSCGAYSLHLHASGIH